MVFGHDIVFNVYTLSSMVDNVEVVLFHTPALNNFPSRQTVGELFEISRKTGISYTVHLPTSLDIASPDAGLRAGSTRQAIGLINLCSGLSPRHFILHIPYVTPTLVYEPGQYFKAIADSAWRPWLKRAGESLVEIAAATGNRAPLLIENINYSLTYVEPLIQEGLCHVCLDVGHLLLGEENVTREILRYSRATREIHLHGVTGYTDHCSLSVLSLDRLSSWLKLLADLTFSGILNLEVFTPSDLKSSMELLDRLCITSTPS